MNTEEEQAAKQQPLVRVRHHRWRGMTPPTHPSTQEGAARATNKLVRAHVNMGGCPRLLTHSPTHTFRGGTLDQQPGTHRETNARTNRTGTRKPNHLIINNIFELTSSAPAIRTWVSYDGIRNPKSTKIIANAFHSNSLL